ncbi:MAG: hypothetical protein ABIT09_08080 [Croceibacterium sp.]
MSNIPNSAMPRAWAHDDDDEDLSASANQQGFTLTGLAIAGAVTATVYWLIRRN